MSNPQTDLLYAFEVHSVEEIQKTLAKGVDPNGLINGQTPLMCLVEMYYRSPKFSECIRCLVEAGARCNDAGLLAVLLDDTDLLADELKKNPALKEHRVDLRSAFTPLLGATLLHVAAEFGHVKAAAKLLAAGANIDARAGVDPYGFNGQTPIFHTVCQHRNHCRPVLELLLGSGAKADLRLDGITWGKGFEWETTIFDPTPLSYTQAGLLPQFQRDERDVYANIRLLAQACGRSLPENMNVPNEYLQASR
jgi:Ankyrin repeats (3 copies)